MTKKQTGKASPRMRANRKYKDSMFTMLFNKPDEARKLYNAITGSGYGPEIPIVITTLQNIFYRTQRNDLSFLIDDKLVIIFEHQSTLNPNMPIRIFLYAAAVYRILIKNKALYGGKIELPRPEFIILYNGPFEMQDMVERRLSDLFKYVEGHDRIDLEVIVRIYNINNGRNEAILAKCETLKGYAVFVAKVQEYLGSVKGLSQPKRRAALRKAIQRAIEYCIANNILQDFMIHHGAEVTNMLTAEFDINLAEKFWREEAREEGREEGLEEGREEGLEEGKKEERTKLLALINQGYTLEQLKERLSVGIGDTQTVQS